MALVFPQIPRSTEPLMNPAPVSVGVLKVFCCHSSWTWSLQTLEKPSAQVSKSRPVVIWTDSHFQQPVDQDVKGCLRYGDSTYKCLRMRLRWECFRTCRSLLTAGKNREQGGQSQTQNGRLRRGFCSENDGRHGIFGTERESDVTQVLRGYSWLQSAQETGGEKEKEIMKEAIAVIQTHISPCWTKVVHEEVGEILGFWICF